MKSLSDRISDSIISTAKSLVIVADEDNLFDYREICQILLEKGFQIIKAADDLDARIKFELEMRGKSGKILLVAPPGYSPLPDIEERVHFVSIGLKDVLPSLSEKVIKGLNYSTLERLSQIKLYENQSDESTISLIFENIYSVNSQKLHSSSRRDEIFNSLINILSEDDELNEFIENYLLRIASKYFPEITRETLRKNKFYELLQQKWEAYLNGSKEIDFTNPSLMKNINHLFATNQLKPVKINENIFQNYVETFPLGIYLDNNKNEQFKALLTYIRDEVDGLNTHEQWLSIIQSLAQAMLISFEVDEVFLQQKFEDVSRFTNQKFQSFIETKYSSLFSLSGIKNPAVVSKILENIKFKRAPKKALFVIDGMNYWQWLLIAGKLKDVGIEFNTSATFAFIPSITAWSRQAIFRGGLPDLSMDNRKEGNLFREYWRNNGYNDYQIEFIKITSTQKELFQISGSNQILGIVNNDLDEMMHGTIMGNIELREKTNLWLEKYFFIDQIKQLKADGYKIFIATDHGSIEAKGIKNLKMTEKVGSLSRSKRHIQFSNQTMLKNFESQNPTLDYGTLNLSAYLKNDEAFTTENSTVVTHGGSHFWEVLTPFITI